MSIIGTKVQARWGSKGELYDATITAINSDGTVKVRWAAVSSTGKPLVTSRMKMEKIVMPTDDEPIDDAGLISGMFGDEVAGGDY
mmetsp:Transcript_22934/g.40963  ORF Transcript_22934/g.40963 Transcript_22934/m.40963 type:complete len:85 (+) Transcript_22934:166-420(+)